MFQTNLASEARDWPWLLEAASGCLHRQVLLRVGPVECDTSCLACICLMSSAQKISLRKRKWIIMEDFWLLSVTESWRRESRSLTVYVGNASRWFSALVRVHEESIANQAVPRKEGIKPFLIIACGHSSVLGHFFIFSLPCGNSQKIACNCGHQKLV